MRKTLDSVWDFSDAARGRHKPVAVVVDHRVAPRALHATYLAEDGWRVRTCPGPPFAECPALGGDPCPRLDDADILVVAATHPRFEELLRACGDSRARPGVVVTLPHGRSPLEGPAGRVDAFVVAGERPALRRGCRLAQERGAERRARAS